MIYPKYTNFEYRDRGFEDTVVLIPGWASDYRIYDSLNIKFNYLIPIDFSPIDFKKELMNTLRRDNISKISLLGWSLGGFIAKEAAINNKELVDRIILISIRKTYGREEINRIKNYIRQNKRAYLYKFYQSCFYEKDKIPKALNNLFREYSEGFAAEYLLSTLDYLIDSKIDPDFLREIGNIKIIHGEYDCIAPIQEAADIAGDLPEAEFVRIKDTGHLPFLKEGFYNSI